MLNWFTKRCKSWRSHAPLGELHALVSKNIFWLLCLTKQPINNTQWVIDPVMNRRHRCRILKHTKVKINTPLTCTITSTFQSSAGHNTPWRENCVIKTTMWPERTALRRPDGSSPICTMALSKNSSTNNIYINVLLLLLLNKLYEIIIC